MAGGETVLAIPPAGTANLLATNLGIPTDLAEAVRVGLHGVRRGLDTGSVNGEHFAVTAGAGFDARMIQDADRGMKDRIGRAAYAWTGARNLGGSRPGTGADEVRDWDVGGRPAGWHHEKDRASSSSRGRSSCPCNGTHPRKPSPRLAAPARVRLDQRFRQGALVVA